MNYITYHFPRESLASNFEPTVKECFPLLITGEGSITLGFPLPTITEKQKLIIRLAINNKISLNVDSRKSGSKYDYVFRSKRGNGT